MKLYSTTCQYYGEAKRACGEPTQQGKSYCADHVWKVYQRGTSKSKSRADAAFERVIQRIETLEDIDPVE